MAEKKKRSLVMWGLGGAALLFLLAVNVFGNKGETRYVTVEPERPRPPSVVAQTTSPRAVPPPSTVTLVHDTAPPPEPPWPENEIDRPGSAALLAQLKKATLYPALVKDFAHESVAHDQVNFVMADEFRDMDKPQRRLVAKGLWAMWAQSNLQRQSDPKKSRVLLFDRQGSVLAKSSYSDGSFIKLEDD